MKPITIPVISALSLLRYRTHSSYIVYSNTAQAIEKKKKKKKDLPRGDGPQITEDQSYLRFPSFLF